MAKTQKRELGDKGEQVVCEYLEDKGYRVLERNYWKPWGEIDIVAEKGSILSFVEVKTVSREIGDGVPPSAVAERARREMLRPEENMHPGKVKRLHRAIQTYLLDHKVPENKVWQLDLACAYLDLENKKARVELLENIVL